MTERRLLQLAVAAGGLVPVGAGAAGILLGPDMIGHAGGDASLDSHWRYLSGLLAGIGIAFWATIPAIERNGGRFRLLAGIVVLGGVARLLSLATAGAPSGPMMLALAMELGVTPALAAWQARVARRA